MSRFGPIFLVPRAMCITAMHCKARFLRRLDLARTSLSTSIVKIVILYHINHMLS